MVAFKVEEDIVRVGRVIEHLAQLGFLRVSYHSLIRVWHEKESITFHAISVRIQAPEGNNGVLIAGCQRI